MRKILALMLAIFMLFSLVACGKKTQAPAEKNDEVAEPAGDEAADANEPAEDSEPAEDAEAEEEPAAEEEEPAAEEEEPVAEGDFSLDTLKIASGSQVESYDYVVSAKTSDAEITANLVEGLLENDQYGKLIPCIAESWEKNEDATVWTFKIRPGVKWMTIDGEEYGEVTAEDFVTGLRHGVEFDSETAWLLQGVIKGYAEYQNSDFSDEEWEKVGVKAIDEYTLEYTMEKPVPYFDTMTTYTVLFPVNREFLEGMGSGCTLGAPNKDDCEFGALRSDTILYCGAYFVTVNDKKSKIQLEANEDYWQADKVNLKTVTIIYDEGQDPYSTIKGFESGTYPSAGLRASWEDYEEYLEKYKDNVYFSIPNSYCFGVIFNYNRQVFDLTNYAEDKTEREKTRKAVLNENFRKALRAAYDKKAALATNAPEAIAEATLRNINNFPEAGTQSDGTLYYDEVMKQYEELTGEKVDLNDGQDAFYNPEKAMEYIEAAKADGIEFPVHLDMLVIETSDFLVKKSVSMAKSISDNTDGQIIVELVMRDAETVQAIAYRETDPAKMDYDISTFVGWGPDYSDPKTFVDVYSPRSGYYMAACGLGTEDEDGNILDAEIKEQLGLMEYEELYRAADEIATDLDARYQAFAKADAKLLEKAFYLPTSMQSRGQVVSKYVPFVRNWAPYGASGLKFKWMKLQQDIVTTEQYEAAEKEWNANK